VLDVPFGVPDAADGLLAADAVLDQFLFAGGIPNLVAQQIPGGLPKHKGQCDREAVSRHIKAGSGHEPAQP